MPDEQSGERAAMRRIDRIKALGDAAALIRAHTDKFIAEELKQVAKRWGRRFLDEALLLKSSDANKTLWSTDPRWPAKNDNGKGNLKDMRDKSKHALSPVTPQARHHFTQRDQVNQLVGASEADPEIGFMTRLLSLCSLPRTDPGNRKEYVRRNGPYKLGMTAGLENKLPFGNLPRLLLAWVCTEAVRTQNRKLILGRSLAEFMRKLGIYHNSGGHGGVQTRLRNQMDRLFNAYVSLIYEDTRGKATVNSPVASRTELWWSPRRPDDPVLWTSEIELGEKFFEEIISHPVPIDMNILKALKRSPLGLDLYLWLVYRTFGLTRPLRLAWTSLYRQFGADPANANNNSTVQHFRKDCLRELHKIKAAWPDLNYKTAKGVLILLPSASCIPPTQLQLVE